MVLYPPVYRLVNRPVCRLVNHLVFLLVIQQVHLLVSQLLTLRASLPWNHRLSQQVSQQISRQTSQPVNQHFLHLADRAMCQLVNLLVIPLYSPPFSLVVNRIVNLQPSPRATQLDNHLAPPLSVLQENPLVSLLINQLGNRLPNLLVIHLRNLPRTRRSRHQDNPVDARRLVRRCDHPINRQVSRHLSHLIFPLFVRRLCHQEARRVPHHVSPLCNRQESLQFSHRRNQLARRSYLPVSRPYSHRWCLQHSHHCNLLLARVPFLLVVRAVSRPRNQVGIHL
jgi:hypothetical protein